MSEIPDLGKLSTLELVSFILGREIGAGASRTVYVFALDPSLVIKHERVSASFSNASEWSIWMEMRDTQWRRWLAPCLQISACGTWLVQRRTEPVAALPKGFKVPPFMADVKAENFGRLNGRIVAHDYGNHRFFDAGRRPGKLIAA